MSKTVILGAGFTGLAAGASSGLPIFEQADSPGGICSSYYKDGFRFERGGGHWIFGGDPAVLHFLSRFCEFKTYERKASVYFADTGEFVRYPIQESEQWRGDAAFAPNLPVVTMEDWLTSRFMEKLCQRFFFPFHEAYTAGLYHKIAPQDGYKTPGNGRGYNATFRYPVEGLDVLAKRIAEKCNVLFNHRVEGVGSLTGSHRVAVTLNGVPGGFYYENVISTLPLNKMMELNGLSVDAEPDPYTSVLVLNIAAKRGPRCPDDHWCYIPQSKSGFHRVGFYSNVDKSFLPKGATDRVSLYVEIAFVGGQTLITNARSDVIAELQEWGWITDVDVVDRTVVEVAYTWKWPGSTWREQALAKLEEHGIYQCGRFAKWKFSGIADSVRDGLMVGAAFR